MNYYDEDCEYSSIENFQENDIPAACNIGNLHPEFVNVCTDGYRGGPNGSQNSNCETNYGYQDELVYICMYGSMSRVRFNAQQHANSLRG